MGEININASHISGTNVQVGLNNTIVSGLESLKKELEPIINGLASSDAEKEELMGALNEVVKAPKGASENAKKLMSFLKRSQSTDVSESTMASLGNLGGNGLS